MTKINRNKLLTIAASIAGLLLIAAAIWFFREQSARRPPNIFDTPVQNVAGYLAGPHFNSLSVEERLRYLRETVQRFIDMNQSESAVLASFFAGLTGPAREQLTANARVLVKDILVEAADEYLRLETEQDKRVFLDRWLVSWVRMGDEVTGRQSTRTDSEIVARMRRDARRDTDRMLERGLQLSAREMQWAVEFWQREIETVASPREQAHIFHFLPALRDHLIYGE